MKLEVAKEEDDKIVKLDLIQLNNGDIRVRAYTVESGWFSLLDITTNGYLELSRFIPVELGFNLDSEGCIKIKK